MATALTANDREYDFLTRACQCICLVHTTAMEWNIDRHHDLSGYSRDGRACSSLMVSNDEGLVPAHRT
jgi:hypothetical protein